MNEVGILQKIKSLEKEITRMSGLTEKSAEALGIEFTIKDTEFLLRMMNQMQIPGPDLDVAQSLQEKIKIVHSVLMEKGVTIK